MKKGEKRWLIALYIFIGSCLFLEMLILDSDRVRHSEQIEVLRNQMSQVNLSE